MTDDGTTGARPRPSVEPPHSGTEPSAGTGAPTGNGASSGNGARDGSGAPARGRTLLRRLLPEPGAQRRLTEAALASSVGQGIFVSCGVVFAVRWGGITAAELGTAMTAGTVLGLLLPVPVGRLVEGVGARRCAVACSAAAAMGVAGYPFARSFPAFCAAVLVAGGSVVGLGIAQNAMVAGLLGGADRTTFKAYQRSVRNLGLAIGALVAAVPLQLDRAPAYQAAIVAGALCVAASAWSTALADPADGSGADGSGAGAGPRLARNARHSRTGRRTRRWGVDGPYVVTAVLCGVTAMRYPVLTVALPLWVTTRTEAPRSVVSLALLLNTGLVIAFQVRAARRAATTRSASRLNLRGGAALAGSCVLFAPAAAVDAAAAAGLVLAGVALFTWGEMWTSAAAWTFGFGLTVGDRHGPYQAAFALGTSVGSAPGPALAVLVASGGYLGWTAGAAAFGATGAATALAVGWALRDGAARTAIREEEY